MALPLLPELPPQKQERLRLLAHQPGFEVLVELFDAACTSLTKRMAKLTPEDRDYDKKLRDYHLEWSSVNEFCAQVMKAIDYHNDSVSTRESEERDAERLLIEKAAQLLRPGNPFGRKVIKSE